MELEHFAHEHPLTLFNNEENENGDQEEQKEDCSGCCRPILGTEPFFSCRKCKHFPSSFVLHKSCAELPNIKKSVYHKHPLTLCWPPSSYICHLCNRPEGGGFGLRYHCSSCEFDLDIGCAELGQTVKHIGHQYHPLTLQLKQASFRCDACGIKHKEEAISYQCATCCFWVHLDCILLPKIIKLTSHKHLLTLARTVQLKEQYRFNINCDICFKDVNPMHLAYYCAQCRHCSHVVCPDDHHVQYTSQTVQNESSVICLPRPDESSVNDLVVNHFIKQISMQGSDETSSGRKELEIRCRCDNQLSLSSSDDSQTEKICDACVRPISSSPYYYNSECCCVVHKSCGELPSEIQRHPLEFTYPVITLGKGELIFTCNACGYLCNGFTFHYGSNFYLDIKCASLPATIRHEAHVHLLNRQILSNSRCNACHESGGSIRSGFRFQCSTCNFNLHIQCALLPKTLRHQYEKHVLVLTYSPVGISSEEFICEICEEDVNPKLWFYYCADCDHSFHTQCLCKAMDKYANIKLGTIIDVNYHPHPLTIAQKNKCKKPPSCDRCSSPCRDITFECSECPFNVHHECIRMPKTTKQRYRSLFLFES